MLELVYSNVYGPFKCLGTGGEQYWVTNLDDYTQISEVTAVLIKNKIIKIFRDFLRRYETADKRCRRHRTDGGEEFIIDYFQKF
jgi:spermidine synthase